MIQNITLRNGQLIMCVTDEVEAAGRAKVRLVLTFLYGTLCIRKVFHNFHCEGCEKRWPSQRDHECYLQSVEEIFENGYDDVQINLQLLLDLCKGFLNLLDLPMTSKWVTFINELPKVSARTMFFFWQDLTHTWDPKEQLLVDFVNMMCNVLRKEGEWDENIFSDFASFMRDE